MQLKTSTADLVRSGAPHEDIYSVTHVIEDQLENRISRQEKVSIPESSHEALRSDDQSLAQGNVLGLLATQLLRLSNRSNEDDESLQEEPQQRESKRRRVESSDSTASVQLWHDESPPLPPPDLLESVIRIYFTHIQPWIPMLHIELFPRKLKTAAGLRKQRLVVHAISLAIEPHLPPKEDTDSSSTLFDQRWPAARVRNWIVTKSMEDVNLEGLQALTIVAFTDVRYPRDLGLDRFEVYPDTLLIDRQRKRFASMVAHRITQSNGRVRPAHCRSPARPAPRNHMPAIFFLGSQPGLD